MDRQNEIELRSEKVRNIVGKIPPILLRIGITIISIIILLVLILAYTLPYPQYYSTDIEITTVPQSEVTRAPIKGMYYSNSQNRDLSMLLSNDTVYGIRAKNDKKTIIANDSFFVHKNDIITLSMPDSIISVVGNCKIPPDIINNIHQGQIVNISLTTGEEYVGKVSEIGKIIQKDTLNNMPYYNINIYINAGTTVNFTGLINSSGKAKILLSDKPILKLILHMN